ncbi:pilin [Micromonospora sp. WMMD1082]|uniref:pilin n=1 Tax=Micromonospora sp. WMMD1082 TaxID=3016104 RepID=UPI0024176FE1|nr:pilin [Micromonospora sp. WMMD1082]MDG4795063.1 pilin [Micromonospora sp. WMMD1082]
MLQIRAITPGKRPGWRPVVHALAALAAAVLILAPPAAAYAAPSDAVFLAANSLPRVIENIRSQIMFLLFGIATLFLVIAGVYWTTAGGDPGQVDKAKGALRNAMIGYGLAVLAPILMTIVRNIVGQ